MERGKAMPKNTNNISPEEYRRKWGVPDWRDEKAYPLPKNMADNAWRWEFMRRNADYREDWEQGGDASEYGMAVMEDPRSSAGFIRFNRLQTFGHKEIVSSIWALGLDPWISEQEHINALKSQLAYLKMQTKSDEIMRTHRDKFPEYLRIIDARAELANGRPISYEKIGGILRPDLVYSDAAKRVHKSHDTAKKLLKQFVKFPK
jgi:hypothetical protein